MALCRKLRNLLLVFRTVCNATAHDVIVRCLFPQSRSDVTWNWRFGALAVENHGEHPSRIPPQALGHCFLLACHPPGSKD